MSGCSGGSFWPSHSQYCHNFVLGVKPTSRHSGLGMPVSPKHNCSCRFITLQAHCRPGHNAYRQHPPVSPPGSTRVRLHEHHCVKAQAYCALYTPHPSCLQAVQPTQAADVALVKALLPPAHPEPLCNPSQYMGVAEPCTYASLKEYVHDQWRKHSHSQQV